MFYALFSDYERERHREGERKSICKKKRVSWICLRVRPSRTKKELAKHDL
jgi:hypothetical protein